MNYADMPERIKERLRDKIRDMFVEHDEWWDACYEDFVRVAEILGIEFRSARGREGPAIYFRGFWSQGDGLCFSGSYEYSEDAPTKIREYAPQDKTLHRIADGLAALQVTLKVSGDPLADLRINGNERYYSLEVSDYLDYDRKEDITPPFKELLEGFASWMYKQLEAEHDYLTSDAYLDEWLSSPENLSSIYSQSEYEEDLEEEEA